LRAQRQLIQIKLNSAAEIVRRYNLNYNTYFFYKFLGCRRAQLIDAWRIADKKISSQEIVRDTKNILYEETLEVNERLSEFDKNTVSILEYLNSPFEPKKLKPSQIKKERRFRRKLSELFIELTKQEIADLYGKKNYTYKKKTISTKWIQTILITMSILPFLMIIGSIAVPRIIDGLTPVETLTIKIHEQSKYRYRIGAICRDGWISRATGRGACSHHGGVSEWVYGTYYLKTLQECRKEAHKLSWRD